VQLPDVVRSYNRYAYCLNNPLAHTDLSGEKWWHWLLAAVGVVGIDPVSTITSVALTTGTLGTGAGVTFASAIATTGMAAGTAQSLDFGVTFFGTLFSGDTQWGGRRFENSLKLIRGLLQIDENRGFWANAGILLSRWTWESPQTIAGLGYSHFRNFTGNVDRVDYFGGATFVINENASKRNGVSLGNFININIDDEITGSFQDRVLSDPLFMHEYGHTFDSRNFGLSYLFAIGIPSLISADNSKWQQEKGYSTHDEYWTEVRANNRAAKYFKKYYGINWNFPDYPLSK
jgi:hypothetical protein